MDARDVLLGLLGRFPQRGASGCSRSHVMDADGYSMERVSYETEPGEAVSAYLLLPEGKGPHPAIVACHQHNDEYFVGKSEPAGLFCSMSGAFGAAFCRAGFAVICPDCLGFEDRRPPEFERKANPFLEGFGYERHLFIDYLLAGSTLQAKYISDLVCAVDVLASLPEVDSSRIGVCGHSLGGQEALWLGWYDERVKAVACSCGTAEIQDLQDSCINHNLAMYLPGLLGKGLDMHSVIASMAPKPFMLMYGADDLIFPSWSVDALAGKVEEAYAERGAAGSFIHRCYGHGHGFYPEMQEDAIRFIADHL